MCQYLKITPLLLHDLYERTHFFVYISISNEDTASPVLHALAFQLTLSIKWTVGRTRESLNRIWESCIRIVASPTVRNEATSRAFYIATNAFIITKSKKIEKAMI